MKRFDLAFVCLAVLFVGCGDERGTNEETETGGSTTGDGDGDPTTGDGDGEPTTGDGDGEPVVGECDSVDACVVVSDCCTCDVVVVGQEPPCDVPECFAPACEAAGIPAEAACLVGTCTFAPLSCDLNDVVCDIVEPPPCEIGLVRSVVDNCYGACVAPSLCATLPSECDAGTCGDGFACVTTQTGGPSRCVPLPPGRAGCAGSPSCDCVAPWWDEVCVGSCGDGGGTLLCEDGG